MKHLVKKKLLKRESSHRKALILNLVCSFLKNEEIVTTKVRAKVASQFTEKLITKAKKFHQTKDKSKKLHYIRLVHRFIKDKEILYKIFVEISPRFLERNGGYTRIYKLGFRATIDSVETYLLRLTVSKTIDERIEWRKNFKELLKEKGYRSLKIT